MGDNLSLRLRAAQAGAGLHGAAGALAWLYLYSVLWLGAYTLLSTLAFGWTPVVITGGSMSPAIRPGDLVMLADVQGRAGRSAVITFRASDRDEDLVTHRVTAVLPEGYRTRGDANPSEDTDVVASEDVVGVGRLLVPALGRPLLWARQGDTGPLAAWAVATAAAVAFACHKPRGQPEEPDVAPALPTGGVLSAAAGRTVLPAESVP